MQTEHLHTAVQSKPEPCASGCGALAMEHPRYYTGKYLTARDFQDEHEYIASRHQLHNRLLHGWGIVCGLEVVHHPHWIHHTDTDCARRWVVVKPGIAIDCCGREIVVPERLYFELPLPRYKATEQTANSESAVPSLAEAPDGAADVMRGPFLLGLCYDESDIECVPALYAEGPNDPKRLEANRVREGARLVVRRLDQVDVTCWRGHVGEGEPPCRDDCDDERVGPAGTCVDPDCPCGSMVPLALIHPHDEHGYLHGYRIDDRGRRYVGTAPELLTHIVSVNWPHGGEVTLHDLREVMHGRLEMRFDRRLRHREHEVAGVNKHTFVVQDRDDDDDVNLTPYEEGKPPHLEEEGCLAVYTIDSRALRPRGENIAGNILYVTLKCDFILDCHGNAIDGNFLGGRFPTGDGVMGGTFESWFRVVSDGERQER